MKTLNRRDLPGASHPTYVIRFDERSFLWAFVDWQLDIFNGQTDLNAGVAIVCPISTDFPPSLNTQDGLYTTLIRELDERGETVSEVRLIRSVGNRINPYQNFAAHLALARNTKIRFVFSNTTEAGISYRVVDRVGDAPPVSFPAKLTHLLLERLNHFTGTVDKGWVIIPCELIDYNGEVLKTLVLRCAQGWRLPPASADWAETANTFCSTLVDHIVTGYPHEEVAALEAMLSYHDTFLDTTEHFHLFVIQGPQRLAEELKLAQCSPSIRVVSDIRPYRERKVAILNGAHTALVPVAWLCGLETVSEAIQDAGVRRFIERVVSEEIIPVLDLPADELREFANAVNGRFQNLYIRH